VDWHPTKAVIAAGSKNSLIKLWDPKSGKCLSTLHGHKNTVSCVRWNKNGHWLLSTSRDQMIKMWDIRMMRETCTHRGHKKEATTAVWHPFIETLFTSGSFDGSIRHWVVGDPESRAEICGAHDGSVWALAWHPLGHVLASGSSDNSTRFWTRNRPGDEMRDKYNANQLPEEDKEDALLALAEVPAAAAANE